MRLGAFVLTYNRPVELDHIVRVLLEQSRPPEFILVVDNANSSHTAEQVTLMRDPRVGYEATGANLGSAGGTEYGNLRLAELGFDLIYSGDDDDPPRTPDTLERVINLIRDGGADGAGAVGTRWDWKTGRVVRLLDEELHGPIEVDFIGGGQHMILRREVIEAGAVPDGRLFFGYPDLDHCLRMRAAGFRLMIDGDLMRIYRETAGRIGLKTRRSIVPRRDLNRLWRNYYTTRNYISMMRDRFGRPDLARQEAGRAILRSLASWLKGPRYGAKSCYYHTRGILDGYRSRSGPVIQPRAKR